MHGGDHDRPPSTWHARSTTFPSALAHACKHDRTARIPARTIRASIFAPARAAARNDGGGGGGGGGGKRGAGSRGGPRLQRPFASPRVDQALLACKAWSHAGFNRGPYG